jgi:hypothetical protein
MSKLDDKTYGSLLECTFVYELCIQAGVIQWVWHIPSKHNINDILTGLQILYRT